MSVKDLFTVLPFKVNWIQWFVHGIELSRITDGDPFLFHAGSLPAVAAAAVVCLLQVCNYGLKRLEPDVPQGTAWEQSRVWEGRSGSTAAARGLQSTEIDILGTVIVLE